MASKFLNILMAQKLRDLFNLKDQKEGPSLLHTNEVIPVVDVGRLMLGGQAEVGTVPPIEAWTYGNFTMPVTGPIGTVTAPLLICGPNQVGRILACDWYLSCPGVAGTQALGFNIYLQKSEAVVRVIRHDLYDQLNGVAQAIKWALHGFSRGEQQQTTTRPAEVGADTWNGYVPPGYTAYLEFYFSAASPAGCTLDINSMHVIGNGGIPPT